MLGSAIINLLRTMFYGWIFALKRLLKLLCRPRTPPKRPEHRPTQSGCVGVDHPTLVRPDPLLYLQRYLMAQGIAVTWGDPDITLYKVGLPVSSADLAPSTTYEIRARIWNNSLEAPVIHMPVRLSYLDFDFSVGVKGSADQPHFAFIAWTMPPDIILRVRKGFQVAQTATIANQAQPEHQWHLHPELDGCAREIIL